MKLTILPLLALVAILNATYGKTVTTTSIACPATYTKTSLGKSTKSITTIPPSFYQSSISTIASVRPETSSNPDDGPCICNVDNSYGAFCGSGPAYFNSSVLRGYCPHEYVYTCTGKANVYAGIRDYCLRSKTCVAGAGNGTLENPKYDYCGVLTATVTSVPIATTASISPAQSSILSQTDPCICNRLGAYGFFCGSRSSNANDSVLRGFCPHEYVYSCAGNNNVPAIGSYCLTGHCIAGIGNGTLADPEYDYCPVPFAPDSTNFPFPTATTASLAPEQATALFLQYPCKCGYKIYGDFCGSRSTLNGTLLQGFCNPNAIYPCTGTSKLVVDPSQIYPCDSVNQKCILRGDGGADYCGVSPSATLPASTTTSITPEQSQIGFNTGSCICNNNRYGDFCGGRANYNGSALRGDCFRDVIYSCAGKSISGLPQHSCGSSACIAGTGIGSSSAPERDSCANGTSSASSITPERSQALSQADPCICNYGANGLFCGSRSAELSGSPGTAPLSGFCDRRTIYRCTGNQEHA